MFSKPVWLKALNTWARGARAARLLEPYAMLWIELARKHGHGAEFAFALQRMGGNKG